MKRKPPAKTAKRVLIVDDHPFLRMGLAASLGMESGLGVCGAVGNAEEALEAVGKLHPDIVVTDLNLPGKSGLELITEISGRHPGLPVIVLSMHEEEVYAGRCLRAGARGYVMKSEGVETLAAAIRRVLGGEIHVSAETSARILETLSSRKDEQNKTPLGLLTAREFEVFELFGRGVATKEIALQLRIGAKTVETHRMHIKTKLGLATAQELVAYAARWVASGV